MGWGHIALLSTERTAGFQPHVMPRSKKFSWEFSWGPAVWTRTRGAGNQTHALSRALLSILTHVFPLTSMFTCTGGLPHPQTHSTGPLLPLAPKRGEHKPKEKKKNP